jgi:hypothetical protein
MTARLADGSIISLGTTFGSAKTVSAISNANPGVATSTAHGLTDGCYRCLGFGLGSPEQPCHARIWLRDQCLQYREYRYYGHLPCSRLAPAPAPTRLSRHGRRFPRSWACRPLAAISSSPTSRSWSRISSRRFRRSPPRSPSSWTSQTIPASPATSRSRQQPRHARSVPVRLACAGRLVHLLQRLCELQRNADAQQEPDHDRFRNDQPAGPSGPLRLLIGPRPLIEHRPAAVSPFAGSGGRHGHF